MTHFLSKAQRPSAWSTAALAISLLMTPVTASAASLIGFVDNSPSTGGANFSSNHATSWTQTVATSGVSLRALLYSASPAPTNWWLTTAIGPSATVADVVASGIATPAVTGLGFVDFDPLARTTLATGLNLGAGTYYLVFENSVPSLLWESAVAIDSILLAPGFTFGPDFHTFASTAFGPSATFVVQGGRSVIEVDGLIDAAVPEPATWAMMLAGFGMIGAGLRRRGSRQRAFA